MRQEQRDVLPRQPVVDPALPTLLIVDAEDTAPRVEAALESGLAAGVQGHLDVLPFVDNARERVHAAVSTGWKGTVTYLDSAAAIAAVSLDAKRSLIDFVSRLRLDLFALAESAVGAPWAQRFGRLWWYTKLAEKNTLLDDVWSVCVRAEAVQRTLATTKYAQVLVVAPAPFGDLVRAIAAAASVPCEVAVLSRPRARLERMVAMRLFAAIGVVAAVLWARMSARRVPRGGRTPVVVFSWPEFWRERFGRWEDVYLGRTIDCTNRRGDDPLYVLGLYGRPYLSFRELREQFRRIRLFNWRGIRYTLLEGHGSLRGVLREYLRVSDVTAFVRLVRAPRYRAAFDWRGLNLADLFAPLMWESVIVRWPNLLVQDELARRVVNHQQADVAMVYSFEYLAGRALTRGAQRAGARVLGVQHGPMSTMRFLYAGTPDELQEHHGFPPCPQPDIYAVDGRLSADLLALRGIAPADVHVVGAARFDDVWEMARRVRSRERCRQVPRSIMVALGLHDTEYVVRCVLAAFAGDGDVRLIIRPHPKIGGERVLRVISQEAALRTLPAWTVAAGGEVYEKLAEADTLIGTYSSTLVEAIAFGVPIVLLTSGRRIELSPFFGADSGVLSASTVEALRAHVRTIAEDEAFRRTYTAKLDRVLRHVFDCIEVNAAERLASCLHGVAFPSGAPEPSLTSA